MIENVIKFINKSLKIQRKNHLNDLENVLLVQRSKLNELINKNSLVEIDDLISTYISEGEKNETIRKQTYENVAKILQQVKNAVTINKLNVDTNDIDKIITQLQEQEPLRKKLISFANTLKEIGITQDDLDLQTQFGIESLVEENQLLFENIQGRSDIKSQFEKARQLRQAFTAIQLPVETYKSSESARKVFISQMEQLIEKSDLDDQRKQALKKRVHNFATKSLFETGIDASVLIPGANLTDLIIKGEKIGVGKQGEKVVVTSSSDIIKQMIGLRTKQVTGITTDTQLQMQQGISKMQDVVGQLNAKKEFDQQLEKFQKNKQVRTLIDVLEKYDFNQASENIFELVGKKISQLKPGYKMEDMYTALFENLDDIPAEDRESYLLQAEKIFGLIYTGDFARKALKTGNFMQFLSDKFHEKLKETGVYFVQFFPMFESLVNNLPKMREMFIKTQTQFQEFMAHDVQKTVSKGQSDIIIQPLLTILKDEGNFKKINDPEIMQQLMSQIYNTFLKQPQRFNMENIKHDLRDWVKEDMVDRIKQIFPQNMQGSIIESLKKMMKYDTMEQFVKESSGEDIKNIQIQFSQFVSGKLNFVKELSIKNITSAVKKVFGDFVKIDDGDLSAVEESMKEKFATNLQTQFENYLQIDLLKRYVDIDKSLGVRPESVQTFKEILPMIEEEPSGLFAQQSQISFLGKMFSTQFQSYQDVIENVPEIKKISNPKIRKAVQDIMQRQLKRRQVEQDPDKYINIQRVLRGNKGGREQYYQQQQRGREFGGLLTEGILKRLKQYGVQDYMYPNELLPVPSELQHIRNFIETQELDAEKAKKQLLDNLKLMDLNDEELRELEDVLEDAGRIGEFRNTEQHQKSVYKTFTTGTYIPLGSSGTGGIIIMPTGKAGTLQYKPDYESLSRTVKYFYKQPNKVISSSTYYLGNKYKYMQRPMYEATDEFGIPLGLYNRVEYDQLRPDRQFEIFKELQKNITDQQQINKLNILDRENFSYKTFDIFRGVVQQSDFVNTQTSQYREFREKVMSILKPEEILSFMKQGALGYNDRVPDQKVLDLIQSRILENFGSVEEFIKQQRSYVYYQLTPRLQSRLISGINIDQLIDSMTMIHKLRFASSTIQIQPRNFLDPISLQSANDIGSIQTIKFPSENQQQIQNIINPFQNITDNIRAVTTYVGKEAMFQISKRRLKRFNIQSATQLQNLNFDVIANSMRNQEFQFEQVNLGDFIKIKSPYSKYFNTPGEDIDTTHEMPGTFFAITAVLDKDVQAQRKVFNEIGAGQLVLEGDAYVLSKKISKQIKVLERDEFGRVFQKDKPEMYKLTGVARSKGMVIQEFEKDLYAKITVGDREMFLPIHMIMNTQGKRKNKLAEFGLSTLRMEQFKNIVQGNEEQIEIDTQQFNKLQSVVENVTERVTQGFDLSDLNRIIGDKENVRTTVSNMISEEFERVYGMKAKQYQDTLSDMFIRELESKQADKKQITPNDVQEFLTYNLLKPQKFTDETIQREFEQIFKSVGLGEAQKKMYAGFQQQQELFLYRNGRMESLGVTQPVTIEKMFVDVSKDQGSKLQGMSVFYAQTLTLQKAGGQLFPQSMAMLADDQGKQQLQKIQNMNLNPMLSLEIATQASMDYMDRTYDIKTKSNILKYAAMPYIRFFDIGRHEYSKNKRDLLVKFQNKFRKLGPKFEQTSKLIELFQRVNDTQTLISKNLSAITIPKNVQTELAQLTGEEIYIPQQFIENTLKYIGKNKQYSKQVKLLKKMVSLMEQTGQYETVEAGGAAAKMLKIRIPQMFSIKGGRTGHIILTPDAETLLNMYQSMYSFFTGVQSELDFGTIKEHQGFFAGRVQQLQKRYTGQYLMTITKKHGLSIYQTHATASQDLRGVNIPIKPLRKLLAQSVLRGYITEEEIPQNLRNEILPLVKKYGSNEMIQERVIDELDRFLKQQIYFKNENNRVIAYLSPEQKRLVSRAGMRTQLQQQMPNIPVKGVEFVEDTEEQVTEFRRNVIKEYLAFAEDAYQRSKKIHSGIKEYFSRLSPPSYRGEIWGLLTRHPVIGHQPFVRAQGFSQKDTIEVPLPLAEQIAGDDDGDMISLLPNIIIQPDVFSQRGVIRNELGIWDISQANMWRRYPDYFKWTTKLNKLYIDRVSKLM